MSSVWNSLYATRIDIPLMKFGRHNYQHVVITVKMKTIIRMYIMFSINYHLYMYTRLHLNMINAITISVITLATHIRQSLWGSPNIFRNISFICKSSHYKHPNYQHKKYITRYKILYAFTAKKNTKI